MTWPEAVAVAPLAVLLLFILIFTTIRRRRTLPRVRMRIWFEFERDRRDDKRDDSDEG